MRTRSETKRSRAGFTLIELLAVIAIIGILASIVVPNVARYIARAKVTKAISEIKNADTALIGALSDTGRSSFRDFLTDSARRQLDNWSQQIRDGNFTAVREAGDFYNNFFYELLRQGRDSEFIIANVVPEVRQKLGTSYIDLGTDSWGNQYQFWMGSLRQGSMILRSFRVRDDAEAIDLDDPSFTSFDAYIYNQARRSEEQAQLPGQPKRDDMTLRFEYEAMFPNIQAYGFPAPKDQPVYMWSIGPNFINDAHLLFQMNLDVDLDAPEFLGGGDDPNNWDNASGWEDAPR